MHVLPYQGPWANVQPNARGTKTVDVPRTSDFTRILHPQSDWRVERNMVFHLYASAAGVSISETVLVGADGGERLTQLPRALIVNEIGV